MKKVYQKPDASEHAPYYAQYIALVNDPDPIHLMKMQIIDLQALLADVPMEKENYRYADGKWTIKELIGHIIDCERIFAYRALRIGRGDNTPLPGFEEDDYVKNTDFNKRSLPSLGHEFGLVRESTLALYNHFSEEELLRKGTANGHPISVRAILYIMAGHQLHHERVLRERYLPEL
jgi:uncharacterized damage-inducible protein DinB